MEVDLGFGGAGRRREEECALRRGVEKGVVVVAILLGWFWVRSRRIGFGFLETRHEDAKLGGRFQQ